MSLCYCWRSFYQFDVVNFLSELQGKKVGAINRSVLPQWRLALGNVFVQLRKLPIYERHRKGIVESKNSRAKE